MSVELARETTIDALVALHGGELDEAARGRAIRRVAAADEEGASDAIVPVLRPQAIEGALASDGLLLVDASLAARVPAGHRWVHGSPAWVLASLLATEDGAQDERALAHVDPRARIAPSARIGAFAVVRDDVTIGEGCVVEPHAVLYPGVVLGRRVHVGAHAVVGRPGFGWATSETGEVRRVPQRGGVIVDDDVELGPFVTVDAGTLAPTRIRRGTKLDAHVHVAHNVELGEGVLVAAQSGFAGSVSVGARVLVGGQVGVADHVTIGRGARLAAKAGVIGDVPAGATFAGYPAVARVRWLRGMARLFGKAWSRRSDR